MLISPRATRIDLKSRRRSGSSYLEVQVAFAVLGISLAGLVPVVVSQLRMTDQIEAFLPSGEVHYLAPAEDPWARKLGVSATLSATNPGPSTEVPTSTPINRIEIILADVAGPNDFASVEVLVEESPTSP